MKGLIYRVKRYYKKRVIPYFRKTLGINELEDNIYTLLNSATDITKCSPATGTLRSIQLTSVELLKLVDLICRKENLTYWLDWGTLLGAVRHKGFIPWDDDLDICMPREDYLRAISVFSAFFADKNGFDVQNQKQAETEWMWINYWNAGIHLDIFPIDSFAADRQTSAEELRRIVSERRRAKREARNDSFKSNESPARRIFYYPLNIWASDRFFEEDFIFPLRELPFEGYSFFVPDQYAGYLTTEYGSYMDYPRSRILIHREISEMPDATGTDLNEIKELLRALQKEVG